MPGGLLAAWSALSRLAAVMLAWSAAARAGWPGAARGFQDPELCRAQELGGGQGGAVGAEDPEEEFWVMLGGDRRPDLLAGPDVPLPNRAVSVGGDQHLAVGAERDAVGIGRARGQVVADLAVASDAPQSDLAVLVARGGQDGAVGAEGQPEHGRAHGGLAADRPADLAAGGDVPQPGPVLPVGGRQDPPASAERHGEQPAAGGHRRPHLPTGSHIPEPRLAADPGRGQELAVGAEGDPEHPDVADPDRPADLAAAGYLPQPRGPIRVRRGQHIAARAERQLLGPVTRTAQARVSHRTSRQRRGPRGGPASCARQDQRHEQRGHRCPADPRGGIPRQPARSTHVSNVTQLRLPIPGLSIIRAVARTTLVRWALAAASTVRTGRPSPGRTPRGPDRSYG